MVTGILIYASLSKQLFWADKPLFSAEEVMVTIKKETKNYDFYEDAESLRFESCDYLGDGKWVGTILVTIRDDYSYWYGDREKALAWTRSVLLGEEEEKTEAEPETKTITWSFWEKSRIIDIQEQK